MRTEDLADDSSPARPLNRLRGALVKELTRGRNDKEPLIDGLNGGRTQGDELDLTQGGVGLLDNGGLRGR